MIKLTRLNGAEIVVNADVVESLEATPDTVLSLVNGEKFAVRETIDEVIEKVVRYQQQVRNLAPPTITAASSSVRQPDPERHQE